MFENMYQTLSQYGFTHPLHPIAAHLPIGLIVGSVLFALISYVFRVKALAATARHCRALGFFMLLPTMALGYADWRHFFGGAWLFEIKMKMLLAGLLVVFLLLLMFLGRKHQSDSVDHLPLYFICLLIVAGLGYFGGELVFGEKKAGLTEGRVVGLNPDLARRGEQLFVQRCAFCHFSDRPDAKVGPGLKDLFKHEKLPSSGRPVSRQAVEHQLRIPYKDMPAFDQLTDEQTASVLEYLRTL